MKRNLILLATTTVLCTTPLCLAQATPSPTPADADPFAGGGDAGAAPVKLHNGPLSVRYEVFSMPRLEAANLMRTSPADDQLYATLIKLTAEQKASLENMTIARALSGQRVTAESIVEKIYPTEWEPPELPNQVGVAISPPPVKDVTNPVPDATALKAAPNLEELPELVTPAHPTSFETRNTGVTVEFEAIQGETGLINLRVSPEHVHLDQRISWGQGVSEIESPQFIAQKLTISTILRPDSPHLLGTLNPPDTAQDPKEEVWFAFITVSLVN